MPPTFEGYLERVTEGLIVALVLLPVQYFHT